MTTPTPTDVDLIALARLLPYVRDAIAAQPAHIGDQLRAALADGLTTLRFEPSAVGVVVIVTVDGVDLAEVDVRNVVDIE